MADEKKEAKKPRSLPQFLRDKNITLSPKVYFVDALGAMAFGLFASLLIGTIFTTLNTYVPFSLFEKMAGCAKMATGAAIGVAIAYVLKAPPLVLYTCAAVGMAGYQGGVADIAKGDGGPVGAYLAVLIAVELGKLVSKETKIDILLTPTVTLGVGTAVAIWVGPPISKIMTGFGQLINSFTDKEPILMGAAVAALVGMALTLPISSAAICVMLGLSGLAGGAATAGCCAQMIGFAIMSYQDNGWGGLVAQGLGTSMLQMPNIVKKPYVWLPPTIAGALCGILSTTVFKLENSPIGSGMGTCGLVGPLGIISEMHGGVRMWLGILLVCFIVPGFLTYFLAMPMRSFKWIIDGDLKLDTGN